MDGFLRPTSLSSRWPPKPTTDSPPSTLTKEPWKKTKDWGERHSTASGGLDISAAHTYPGTAQLTNALSNIFHARPVCELPEYIKVRNELKQHVAQLAPECRDDMDVPSFRIVLTGQIGAGKSSVVNSLKSVYEDKVVTGADVGELQKSLTNKFREYKMMNKNTQPFSLLPWTICDTMGLSPNEQYDVRNILSAVDGHVLDKHVFTGGDYTQDSPGFISNPAIGDRAHCIAIVIGANSFKHMENKMKKKLNNLRIGLIARNILTYIILTKVDTVCDDVEKDVSTVYRSIAVRNLISEVSKMMHGLPESQIFPVVNYNKQIELDVNMDILLLNAVRQMLYSAQAYLEHTHLHTFNTFVVTF